MSIDNRSPSAWNQLDLRQVCEENRRETQALEFKAELNLDTEGKGPKLSATLLAWRPGPEE